MKILFLDIDGVLNSEALFRRRPPDARLEMNEDKWWAEMLDPDAIQRLNRILAETGAKVVVSSTWRFALGPDDLQRILGSRGFVGEIIGATPRRLTKRGDRRGDEIAAWLSDAACDVEAFVILDDDSDMGALLPKLIKTTWKAGLQDEHVTAARAMMGEL